MFVGAAQGYFLINQNGVFDDPFKDQTIRVAKSLDYDNDGRVDLISFDSIYIMYQLKFWDRMTLVNDDRDYVMRWNEDYGSYKSASP